MRSLEPVARCRPDGAKLTWVTYLKRERRGEGKEVRRRRGG